MTTRKPRWEAGTGIAQELFFAVAAGLVYLILVLCIDCGIFKCLTALRKSNPPVTGISQAEKTTDRDEDIIAEEKRVEEQLSSGTLTDAIAISDIRKHYGTFAAVVHLTFGVQHGECFGLLGVNGAGKTTTFKMISGDVRPNSGNVYMQKLNILSNRKEFLSQVGYCPQFDAILGVLTGREMVQLFARLRGIKNTSEETKKWLQKVGLLESADVQCQTYSGGMKRRLSTAMAMIGDPPVILLDEPTSGVDPVSRRQFWEIIRSNSKSGQAVILTSHSMDECEALCSRLAIMVNGQFQCFGGVQHIKKKFAQGYSFTVKLKPMVPTDSPELASLMKDIETQFAPCELKDRHLNIIQYQVRKDDLAWGSVFEITEGWKQTYEKIIEEYSVIEMTLDEVFLAFARQQYTGREVAGCCKGKCRCCNCSK